MRGCGWKVQSDGMLLLQCLAHGCLEGNLRLCQLLQQRLIVALGLPGALVAANKIVDLTSNLPEDILLRQWHARIPITVGQSSKCCGHKSNTVF